MKKNKIDKLVLLLNELAQNIPLYAQRKTAVSDADIGWHIEHSLLTLDAIIYRLSQTNSHDFKKKFSFGKFYVFTTRSIPRHRAESPPPVKPKGEITDVTLATHIQLTQDKLGSLVKLSRNQYFEHPYFGHLKLKQALQFLEIHTTHHLKIIRDIKH